MNRLNLDSSEPINPMQGAMVVDFTVKSGLANIYTERTNDRAAYIGNKHFITLSLQQDEVYLCHSDISAIYMHCECPVHISYVDKSSGQLRENTVQQALFIDTALNKLVIKNSQENVNAVVLCYV